MRAVLAFAHLLSDDYSDGLPIERSGAEGSSQHREYGLNFPRFYGLGALMHCRYAGSEVLMTFSSVSCWSWDSRYGRAAS